MSAAQPCKDARALLRQLERLFASDPNAAQFVAAAARSSARKIAHCDEMVIWEPDTLPATARAVLRHLNTLTTRGSRRTSL